MQAKNGQESMIEDIMQKIREEVSIRKMETACNSQKEPQPGDVIEEPVEPKSAAQQNCAQYSLADFLNYHDEEFIRHSYLGILKREPDIQGLQTYLTGLRKGELSKTDILSRLRYSKEGRTKGVRVQGLLLRHAVSTFFRIPFIGYIIEIVVSILKLPQIQKNIRENYNYSYLRISQHENKITQHENKITQHENKITRKADVMTFYWIKGQLSAKADATIVDEIKGQLSAKADATIVDEIKGQLSAKADAYKAEFSSIIKQIKDHKLNIIDQQRRLSLLLEEVRKSLPELISSQQMENIVKEEDHILDAMYMSFEDQFRGTREDIKERLKVYLPYVKKVNAAIEDAPIVDIGCGRGEWLELLKENGFRAKGIDLNRSMVRQCAELDLDVEEHDGIEYLIRQKANSVGVITGFHIIEHLPLRKMVRLFDEVFRVLQPGGMIIFETPNPENLVVGACNFYMDPTHRRPLNPEPVKFIAEQRGFVNIEILRLHKMREIEPTGHELTDEILRRCTMEQDYSVIGYK